MKIKKMFLFLVCVFTINNSFAETEVCPTVNEIKNNQFHYWLPLYIENEELASQADVKKFKDNVSAFVVARWASIYLENGHCFYEGTDSILNKIVFAQDAWKPLKNEKWVWTTKDRMAECYSNNVQDCGFIP